MATYTNQATGCARSAVYAIDVMDVDRHLLEDSVPLSETLGDCGCGSQKCGILQQWVNKKRAIAGKPELAAGTIKPATTIAEVIDHVCS
jgi:hypothetical protein